MNDDASELMDNQQVTDIQFCAYCSISDKCSKKGLPKILQVNQTILKYVYNFEAKVTIYPNPGSWRDQPIWFNKLFDVGRSELSKLKIQKLEDE